MILIKSIDYYEVDRDPIEIINNNPPYAGVPLISNGSKDIVTCEVLSEWAGGRVFINPQNGLEIKIANSKAVQDLIGIQFEAWDNLQAEHETCRQNLIAARRNLTKTFKQINAAHKASVWTRLKWLFKGYNS